MGIYKGYFKKYKGMFLLGITCVFFEAICDLMQPTIMAHIIDQGIKNGQVHTVLRLGFLMLGVTALGAGFAATRNIIASNVSQSFGADLRYDVFSKIIHFSELSADKIESGSLITRMTNDTAQIVLFINGLMRIFFKAPITCIGSIILAVSLSPKLSVILLSAVFVVSIFIFTSMKMSYIRFAKVQYAMDKVNTVVQEYLLGIRLVKAFGRNEEEEKKFEASNGELSRKSIASQMVIAYFSPLMSLTINMGIVLILYFGSILFKSGELEVGRIAAFINYMAQILVSLIMITNIFNVFVRTKASTERIAEVFHSEEDFDCAFDEELSQNKKRGTLAFENVTFAYPSGSGLPAIKKLSFSVARGETLAVIGPTGSGKSTIAWLCLRFYDVQEGGIFVDGRDLKELKAGSLREAVSLAPQKSMLFTGSIYHNISWGNPNATLEKVKKAAEISQATEFIDEMPEGFDSVLGQGGVNVSGGQKQRISIARALVKDSPILILDDCTSALDAVTEAKIRVNLRVESTKKTVVMITQRIGTAMSADKILVLDNGMGVGFGTHSELLENCKTYKEIYDSQIGADEGASENE